MTSPDNTEPGPMEMYLEALQHDRVSEGLDVELSPTFGYVRNVERAESVRRRYEHTVGIKFSTYRQSKDYGKEDIVVSHHKVCWEDGSRLRQGHLAFDHMPYIVVGIKMLDCQYGRDRHVARKKRSLNQSDTHHPGKWKHGTGKKLDCPAQIYLRDILKFPDFAIECNTVWRRKVMSEKLRKSLGAGSKVTGERRIYIKFPEPSDHKGHQIISGPCEVTEKNVPNQVDTIDSESNTLRVLNLDVSGERTSEQQRDELHSERNELHTDKQHRDELHTDKEQRDELHLTNQQTDEPHLTNQQIEELHLTNQQTDELPSHNQQGNERYSERHELCSDEPRRDVLHTDKQQIDEQLGFQDLNFSLQAQVICLENLHKSQTVTRQEEDSSRQTVDLLSPGPTNNNANPAMQCQREIVDVLPANLSSDDSNPGMRCRRLLKELGEQTYIVQDSSILDTLHEELQAALQNVLQAVERTAQSSGPVLSGLLPAEQPTLPLLSTTSRVAAEESVPEKGYEQPHKEVPKRTKRNCKCKEKSRRVSPRAKHVDMTEVVHDRLCTNQSVSIETMQEAQAIILDQFPIVSGFEDPTMGEHLLFSAAQGDFGQLMLDGKDHWVFVTSISCDPGTVKYYDSMGPETIPDSIRKQIASIVCSQDTQISVQIQPVQLANDITDCGLLAIAFAVGVLHSEDPAVVSYDASCLRLHLDQCFKRRSLMPFPKTEQSRERAMKRKISVDVLCLCRMPWNAFTHESRMKMARCSVCGEWWHANYCAVPDASNKQTWKCPRCEDVHSAVAALNSLQSAIS